MMHMDDGWHIRCTTPHHNTHAATVWWHSHLPSSPLPFSSPSCHCWARTSARRFHPFWWWWSIWSRSSLANRTHATWNEGRKVFRFYYFRFAVGVWHLCAAGNPGDVQAPPGLPGWKTWYVLNGSDGNHGHRGAALSLLVDGVGGRSKLS